MRYELTDSEWAAIKPMLPNKPRGVPRVSDRRVLNGNYGDTLHITCLRRLPGGVRTRVSPRPAHSLFLLLVAEDANEPSSHAAMVLGLSYVGI